MLACGVRAQIGCILKPRLSPHPPVVCVRAFTNRSGHRKRGLAFVSQTAQVENSAPVQQSSSHASLPLLPLCEKLWQTAEEHLKTHKLALEADISKGQHEWHKLLIQACGSQESGSQVEQLSCAQLARTAYAMGALGLDVPEEVQHHLLAAASANLHDFSTRELAHLAWGLAEIGCAPDSVWLSHFLGSCQTRVQDFYSPDLCDLVFGVAGLCRGSEILPSKQWVTAFMAEATYQLEEFPGDFKAFDLVKLASAVAELKVPLAEHEGWLDAFLNAANGVNLPVGDAAIINMALARLNAGRLALSYDARCTFEEVHWLPRRERDMRKLSKLYVGSQWSGWAPPNGSSA